MMMIKLLVINWKCCWAKVECYTLQKHLQSVCTLPSLDMHCSLVCSLCRRPVWISGNDHHCQCLSKGHKPTVFSNYTDKNMTERQKLCLLCNILLYEILHELTHKTVKHQRKDTNSTAKEFYTTEFKYHSRKLEQLANQVMRQSGPTHI